MKKVITALGNPRINEKLKQYPEIEIIVNDIQYQEGIFEILEIHTDIDFILLSELLPGRVSIQEIVQKIQKINSKIKIITILEKINQELESNLLEKGNVFVFYNNQIEIKELVENIILPPKKKENRETEKKKQENLRPEEIEKIEQELQEECKAKIIPYQWIQKLIKNKQEKHAKIVSVLGLQGIGKSIFTITLAKILSKQNIKILIIDFDTQYHATTFLLHSHKKKEALQKQEYEKKWMHIKKIKAKISLMQGNDFLSLKENRIDDIVFIQKLEELKDSYDLILMDTITEEENLLETILQQSDKIIFLTEANILQIKKSKKKLEYYQQQWGIKLENIYLIFNKYKEDCIDFDILKEVFKGYTLLGKIDFIRHYNSLINQNINMLFLEKKIKREYLKIGKEILKHPKTKIYYLNKIQGEEYGARNY